VKTVAHPLVPEQRSVSARELAWLIGALAVVLAPHFLRAPWWLTLLTLCLYGWRVYCALTRAPLPSRWLLLGIAAAAMMAVWFESRTLFGRTPGILLLVLFSGLKLMEARSHRDAAVATFLGYFLIITNFLYTQSILTAAAMCVGLLMLTAALVGLSAPMRPLRANLATAGRLLAHAAPAALALFLLFPRVQGPLWGLPQDAHAGISGLSDTMVPGNLSSLALSDAIAFRAEFEGEPPPQPLLYWRGPVLWEFDGRAWRMGPQVFAQYSPPQAGGGPLYRYSMILEAHNREWLFALETAASLPDRARFSADGQVLSQFPVRGRIRYELTSMAVNETRPGEAPTMLRRALRLPQGFNPRSITLAQQWRSSSSTDAEVVGKAITYLRTGRFVYTLEPPLLGEHSVDDFLFDSKTGFCEHFSSAFVFLMRAAGIPARVVMGYQGGDINPIDRIITVRQSDAHAWAEIFLSGRGWVRIDPTAAAAPIRIDSGLARAVPDNESLPYLMRTNLEWLRGVRYRWDALAHKWNVWVLGYNPDRQRELLSFVGIPDADWRALTATLFVILGLLTMALLAWSLRRLARPDPVQLAWRAFCRKLASRGLERAPHEGPRDYSTRAARALPGSRRAILRIGALYIRLRYGTSAGEERHAATRRPVQELRRLVRELRLT
jgi:transglutaminase-like putative cysteine protease